MEAPKKGTGDISRGMSTCSADVAASDIRCSNRPCTRLAPSKNNNEAGFPSMPAADIGAFFCSSTSKLSQPRSCSKQLYLHTAQDAMNIESYQLFGPEISIVNYGKTDPGKSTTLPCKCSNRCPTRSRGRETSRTRFVDCLEQCFKQRTQGRPSPVRLHSSTIILVDR